MNRNLMHSLLECRIESRIASQLEHDLFTEQISHVHTGTEQELHSSHKRREQKQSRKHVATVQSQIQGAEHDKSEMNDRNV
jgi:hypothetical protein